MNRRKKEALRRKRKALIKMLAKNRRVYIPPQEPFQTVPISSNVKFIEPILYGGEITIPRNDYVDQFELMDRLNEMTIKSMVKDGVLKYFFTLNDGKIEKAQAAVYVYKTTED